MPVKSYRCLAAIGSGKHAEGPATPK